jgi:hypothetical protein
MAHAFLMNDLSLLIWYLINTTEFVKALSQAFTGGFYLLDLAAHVTARNLGDGIPSSGIHVMGYACL